MFRAKIMGGGDIVLHSSINSVSHNVDQFNCYFSQAGSGLSVSGSSINYFFP